LAGKLILQVQVTNPYQENFSGNLSINSDYGRHGSMVNCDDNLEYHQELKRNETITTKVECKILKTSGVYQLIGKNLSGPMYLDVRFEKDSDPANPIMIPFKSQSHAW
jgi:hypothetical protein